MKVLLAEDEIVTRRVLQEHLARWGYDVLCASDGEEAWALLQQETRIEMAVLDWMMPGIDGIELCRRIRTRLEDRTIYILLCTARDATEDQIKGLEAGADDYVTKPLNTRELRARLRVGVRTATLELALRRRIDQLREAASHVKQLQGLIPICMHCKSVRDSEEVWHRIDAYLATRSDVQFSHGVCDRCLKELYPGVR